MFGRKYRTIDDIDSAVQMKLYTLSKRQFFLVFAGFFSAVLLTFIIGLNGPSVTLTSVTRESEESDPPSDLSKGPFTLNSPYLSTFNQQLYLWCGVIINHNSSGKITEPFEMTVQILGKEGDSSFEINENSQHRKRKLECKGQKCEDLLVMHLGHLKYNLYTVTVEFDGLSNLPHKIKDEAFSFQTFNPSFTQMEIWFRFGFLLASFITICLFAHPMRKFSIKDWSIEQRWLVILLPLLLLYDNPLFPLTFLVGSWVPNMLDALFQTLFVAALLLFWICTYHGLRVGERHAITFYLPKLLLVFAIWFLAFFFASWEGYHKVSDPTYSTDLDFKSYKALRIIFFILMAVYALYLIFLVIRAWTELSSLPYFDIRLKFLTVFTFIVICACCSLLFIRYGLRLTDSETFAGTISSRYGNSAEFLALYSLLNFYIFTLAYVYSPSKNAYIGDLIALQEYGVVPRAGMVCT